jgi:uncharacterized membrane protein SirB2
MFFRGIDSLPLRAAYLLTAISFVTAPIHFFAARPAVHSALLIFGGLTLVFCLGVGVFHKPRLGPGKVAIIVYSIFAWMMHVPHSFPL